MTKGIPCLFFLTDSVKQNSREKQEENKHEPCGPKDVNSPNLFLATQENLF
jgi:hypothetical protein